MKKFLKKIGYLSTILLFAVLFLQQCRKESCEYIATIDPPAGAGCTMTNTLNLSTGVDTNGNLLAPGKGIVDPFWKLLNNPPLISCSSPLVSTINGSAYVVNFLNSGSTGWVNQPTASTLAPLDLGTTDNFGCNNANNSQGKRVPYVFERSFCVLNNTSVDFNFSFRGDDQIYFELINNNTNAVLSTSSVYTFPATTANWAGSGISLTAGSYSIKAYLVNTSSVVTGFSFTGNLTTSNGDLAISNNAKGCCENNTISILNIKDENCNATFDSADTVGNGFVFNVTNASGAIIATGATDTNGNVFFSGLPNGTYTITIVPQTSWTPSIPIGGTKTVILNNNTVEIIEFYNCP